MINQKETPPNQFGGADQEDDELENLEEKSWEVKLQSDDETLMAEANLSREEKGNDESTFSFDIDPATMVLSKANELPTSQHIDDKRTKDKKFLEDRLMAIERRLESIENHLNIQSSDNAFALDRNMEPVLTTGAKESLNAGYEDVEEDRTKSHEEIKEKFDVGN